MHGQNHIKFAPTCFSLRPSSGSLHKSQAEVMFIKSVKVHCTFTDLINVTLARLKCKLPDDGHRLKHVGAILT